MTNSNNAGFGEKGKRGRPSKASKITTDEPEKFPADDLEEDIDDDGGSFDDGLNESLKSTTVDIPNPNGEISTDEISFDNDKGFNDIPEEEFDLLGESTVKRGYASGEASGANGGASGAASTVSEEPIPEPKYTASAENSNAGFKNEFTDKGSTMNGQADQTAQNKQQSDAEKERIKAEKEQQKANSNVKDLTPEQRKEAAAKTSEMAVEAYATYKPMPFIYFSSHDKKKLEKAHEDNEINLEGKVKKDGTTLSEYVEEFNSGVAETFKVKDETKTLLKEALYDVLMEKDIALTPTQRLVGVLAMDVVGSVVATFQLIGQRKSDMEEIKKMHAETMAEIRKASEAKKARETPPHYNPNPQPAPPKQKPAPQAEPVKAEQPVANKQEPVKEAPMTMDEILNAEIKPETLTTNLDIPLTEAEEVHDDVRDDELFYDKE